MKLRAEVLSVSTCGDTLEVAVQTEAAADARWRDKAPAKFHVADIDRNRKTFHVGRIVEIEIRPL